MSHRSTQATSSRGQIMPAPSRLERLLKRIYRRRRQLVALFFGVFLPLVGFGLLSAELLRRGGFAWDEPMLLWVHVYTTPARTTLFLLFARLGHSQGVYPAAVLIFLLFGASRRWGDALFWALAMSGAGLLSSGGKLFFERIRPNLWQSPAPELSYSFPSGHAMASMAFVAALTIILWPTRWRWPVVAVGAIFVILVGLSRLYLGVHYPSDVLAGWAASLAWVTGVSTLLYGRPVKPAPESTKQL